MKASSTAKQNLNEYSKWNKEEVVVMAFVQQIDDYQFIPVDIVKLILAFYQTSIILFLHYQIDDRDKFDICSINEKRNNLITFNNFNKNKTKKHLFAPFCYIPNISKLLHKKSNEYLFKNNINLKNKYYDGILCYSFDPSSITNLPVEAAVFAPKHPTLILLDHDSNQYYKITSNTEPQQQKQCRKLLNCGTKHGIIGISRLMGLHRLQLSSNITQKNSIWFDGMDNKSTGSIHEILLNAMYIEQYEKLFMLHSVRYRSVKNPMLARIRSLNSNTIRAGCKLYDLNTNKWRVVAKFKFSIDNNTGLCFNDDNIYCIRNMSDIQVFDCNNDYHWKILDFNHVDTTSNYKQRSKLNVWMDNQHILNCTYIDDNKLVQWGYIDLRDNNKTWKKNDFSIWSSHHQMQFNNSHLFMSNKYIHKTMK